MRSMLFFVLLCATIARAQFSNIVCTDAAALQAMKGLHDPADYAATTVIEDHEEILCALRTEVKPDSLRAHLERIVGFGTRHTYSDTVSPTTGIGAARRWAFEKFQQFSAMNEDRLLPAYLQFDYANESGGCGSGQGWRNVLAVLPGSSTTGHRTIIIEAHLDSRCADNCDPACEANGAEDNGSGSALVLELARVLSKYTFKHTLVFMLVTGEEHGLLGSRAMAQFCTTQGIAVKGVLNNDIVGGILCGHTASPPGCGVLDEVDSLQVRIFSHANTRGLAQATALSYNEKLHDEVPVPMLVSVMDREDRVGRGSDHIPFREAGKQSIRFCAANEHGDGDPSEPGYDDRQHTSNDILGLDTDGDLLIDSFFVDFNYLARNAVINGMEASLLALGPETPSFTVLDEPTGLRVQITDGPQWVAYRIGVRGLNSPPAFDALYRTDQTSYPVPGLEAAHVYYISVAGVDAEGITSIFGPEQVRANDAATPAAPIDDLPYGLTCMPIGIEENTAGPDGTMLQCSPNPFNQHTTLSLTKHAPIKGRAFLIIRDAYGREANRLPVVLGERGSAIVYAHRQAAGLYTAELMVDGRRVDAIRLVALE
ncbi:MAG: M28 family peptidase [Flavobacteriales bacterium]|nr:M28 family peptidase [Flavobacteriales bacterium]